MSVTVYRAALLQPVLPLTTRLPETATEREKEEMEKQKYDIWNSIQIHNNKDDITSSKTYIHPVGHRSSILMSQKSLETCTESLGSETGSEELSSGDEIDSSSFDTYNEDDEADEEVELRYNEIEKRDLFNVKYHCSIGRRSPLRSFPPPLPSISRRDGPCFKMQPRRSDGRLVVKAVPVPSVSYLHAERRGGRLLLSFIETSPTTASPVLATIEKTQNNNKKYEEAMKETNNEDEEEAIMEIEEEEEEEEEQEVEVLDRGTIVEVKVNTQANVKVRRSSLVINKFVVGSGAADFSLKRRFFAATTAAAAAAAAAMSSLTSTSEGFSFNCLLERHISRRRAQSPAAPESKLLFTSKRRSREELLHDMRRCSELRRPLFIFEQPYCIAT